MLVQITLCKLLLSHAWRILIGLVDLHGVQSPESVLSLSLLQPVTIREKQSNIFCMLSTCHAASLHVITCYDISCDMMYNETCKLLLITSNCINCGDSK